MAEFNSLAASRLVQGATALPPMLDMLDKALMTVQPTSVEAERAFSVAGRFLTKLRNRMGDDTLDTLVFLNHRLGKRLKTGKKNK